MISLKKFRSAHLVSLLWMAAAVACPGQTLTTIVSFDLTDGAAPGGALVQGLDGNLYGTTYDGGIDGPHGTGTVFKTTASGSLTTLFNFCAVRSHCRTGSRPGVGLALGVSGSLYGTTGTGGVNQDGTVFRISAAGKHTTMYSFCAKTSCADGGLPYGLVQGLGGPWFGVTELGGAGNQGTVFKMTPRGVLSTIYSFCIQGGSCTDGAEPLGTLTSAADGKFYGTTSGGLVNWGTVFKITSDGALTTLYSFCAQTNCSDGAYPMAGLIQATDGSFYGTTSGGGDIEFCSGGCGTVFRITSSSTLTTLYTFCEESNCVDGGGPSALIQATDGNLYGTTNGGGAQNQGTIFRITPSGSLTTLYSFCSQQNCADGNQPAAGLFQATDGNLYGTTTLGGTHSDGTVFKFSIGLDPFVQALPSAGIVGGGVKILGQGLTGTTTVSFNGFAANFVVQSDTYMIATVPKGATTGFISVTTPDGVLTSNNQFRVLQ